MDDRQPIRYRCLHCGRSVAIPGKRGIRPFVTRRAFRSPSAWAVGAAGRVAVVYPDPYHIMLIARDRSATEGPTIPYDRMRVTEEHKQTHRAEAERPRPMMAGRINDPQAASVTMVRRPFREPSGWAEFLPPFVANAEILFDPDGNLWVERTTASPADAQYDVIGRDGTLRHQVLLPAGTRLLGFGRNALYLVRRDDLDLEYLERYSHSGFSP